MSCSQPVLLRCGRTAGGSACSCHAWSATTVESAEALQGCWQQLKKLLDDNDAQVRSPAAAQAPF